MIFRGVAFLMTLVMLYAVVVQLNDPDSVFWVILYGATVLTSALVVAGMRIQPFLWLLLGVYLAAVLWLSPALPNTSLEAFAALSMKGSVEELVRELWGMVFCAVWTLVMIMHGRERHDPRGHDDEAEIPWEQSWR